MSLRTPSVAVMCCVALIWSSAALAEAGDGERVIDIRALQSCTDASLSGARCLPVNNFISAEGKTIGFHALRWLLGTVGLRGDETVLVVGANMQQVKAVGGLFYRAGQRRVRTLDKPFVAKPGAAGGEPRSLSREVVYTAPMRREP